tara:strand:+ start:423 stop:770 length:348 start_codon:yes stop_codon:yes gene_type:complete
MIDWGSIKNCVCNQDFKNLDGVKNIKIIGKSQYEVSTLVESHDYISIYIGLRITNGLLEFGSLTIEKSANGEFTFYESYRDEIIVKVGQSFWEDAQLAIEQFALYITPHFNTKVL